MIRFKTSYVSMLVLSAALLHCGRDKTPAPAAAAPAAQPTTAAATPTPPKDEHMTPASGKAEETTPAAPAPAPTAAAETMTDEQIFKIIDLANASEVDQAKLAQTKAKSAKVKNFAAMMITQHGKARAKASKLSTKLGVTPADTSQSTQLKIESETTISRLTSTPAADFDHEYMEAQVAAHRNVLAALDEKLIPSAKDSELKTLLNDMRSTVEMHLKEAEKIESALDATKKD
ncbi:MAG TPA: DUF4142 domain-containing protein [Polyangiaceae bacterium]|nr:DUF4142 domain-containing protein [Polyangiaceae bacterium]